MTQIEDNIKKLELEERLSKEWRIFEVVPAESLKIPKINLFLWAESSLQICLEKMRHYLTFPYIIDRCDTPAERTEYMNDLNKRDKDLFEYYKQNAFLPEENINLYQISRLKGDYYNGHIGKRYENLDRLINNLNELIYKHRGDYTNKDKRTFDEKIKFCRQIKKQVYYILDFLSQDKDLSRDKPFYQKISSWLFDKIESRFVKKQLRRREYIDQIFLKYEKQEK
ncbi:hypothetical protein HYT57_04050 [Candidatus Woesearchaeota archaeon]|nr:hypothetical protein [Candidatus Woesearchaeota archaeon]